MNKKVIHILRLGMLIIASFVIGNSPFAGAEYSEKNAATTTLSNISYQTSDIQQNYPQTVATKSYVAILSDKTLALNTAPVNTNLVNTSTGKNNILGIEDGKLRKGEVSMDDIPGIIVSIISTLLGIAGSIAIFSLIYHAVQMQINSGITGDSSGVDKAKKGMTGALIGFVIAISAWFLVSHAVELLGNI